jgi:hypothetical protein
MEYLKKRLQEASTWRGIVIFMTGMGVYLTPEQQEAIIVVGLMVAGAIGFLFPDKKKGV